MSGLSAKKISAKYTIYDWPSDLEDRNSPNWSKGIDVIYDRFETRYFAPLRALIKHGEKEIRNNSGFLIMSIDCLIIETLNQFLLGIKRSDDYYDRNNKDSNFKYHWQSFRDFFNYSVNFPELKSNPDVVKLFYSEIRCGLLHQAESKVNSLINIKEPEMVRQLNPQRLQDGIVVNRNLFHSALEQEFQRYLEDLKDPQKCNLFGKFLRETCHTKMSALIT